MSAIDRAYDGTTSAALTGGALTGLVGTELLSFSGQSGAFGDKNVGTAKGVTVSGITLADAEQNLTQICPHCRLDIAHHAKIDKGDLERRWPAGSSWQ